MTKGTTRMKPETELSCKGMTVGLDLSDKFTSLCFLDESGEIMEKARVRTTQAALAQRFGALSPCRVVLEHAAATAKTIVALRKLGVRLAIDDFGTGYSSLSYLRRLKVDSLKIDRSFVRDIETEENTLAIVQSVVSLAHALGIEVTVEGVETAGQLTLLRAAGCDRAQGYYFARPLSAPAFARLLSRNDVFLPRLVKEARQAA